MIWDDFTNVYNLFEDEISKKIYEAKVNWYFKGGIDETNNILYEYYNDSRIVGLENYNCKNVAICGAGNYGLQSYKALVHAGYKVCAFLDNDVNKVGTTLENVEIMSFSQFVTEFNAKDIVVIIDNQRLANMFFSELYELGFDQRKVFRTRDNIVRNIFGNIYFDLNELKHVENEIFIDAGSFNGDTTRDFLRWCGGKYKRIYAFEPMKEGYELTKKMLADVNNISFECSALGDKVGEAIFSKSYSGLMGSRLGNNGDSLERVEIQTIDNGLNGDPVTFIKMDIEGAEFDALKGGIKTLKKYKPKLAISLYHKNVDLITIPLWLRENIPEYKFYLRHYSNKKWDLVLYCVER